jgi:PKD repeat protein
LGLDLRRRYDQQHKNPDPRLQHAGQLYRRLTATGAGGTASKTAATAINVAAPTLPVVNFSASPGSGTAPLNVAFANTTTGQVTTWAWNFGDGTTSNVQKPTHTYSTPGSYTVVLTATGAGGTASKTAASAISVSTPAAPS